MLWSPLLFLLGAVSISAPIDLKAAQLRFMRPRNRRYHDYILARLKADVAAPPNGIDSIGTIYEFDDRIVAPANGFAGAEDYYAKCSASPLLGAPSNNPAFKYTQMATRPPVILNLKVGRASTGTSLLFTGNVMSCELTQPPDIGIALRFFNALRASPVAELRAIADAYRDRMGLFELVMHKQIERSILERGDAIEIRTSVGSAETNSDDELGLAT